MSIPSDTRPDVTDPVHKASNEKTRPHRSQLTPEQSGLMVAALVAFLGITYFGPALTRFRQAPTPRERVARRLRETRRQARNASGKVRKRMRQLGGRTWR